jgi:hypothetical protein
MYNEDYLSTNSNNNTCHLYDNLSEIQLGQLETKVYGMKL